MPAVLRDVRSQGQSGKHVLALSFSGFDPTRTSIRLDLCPKLLTLGLRASGDRIGNEATRVYHGGRRRDGDVAAGRAGPAKRTRLSHWLSKRSQSGIGAAHARRFSAKAA